MICRMHQPMKAFKKKHSIKEKRPMGLMAAMIEKQDNCYLDMRVRGKRLVNEII